MKLKYLNPNVVFVVSGQSANESATLEEPSLTVQLLDSVSGQILYRQTLEVRAFLLNHLGGLCQKREKSCSPLLVVE